MAVGASGDVSENPRQITRHYDEENIMPEWQRGNGKGKEQEIYDGTMLTLLEAKVVHSLVQVNGVFTGHDIVQSRSGLWGLRCQYSQREARKRHDGKEGGWRRAVGSESGGNR